MYNIIAIENRIFEKNSANHRALDAVLTPLSNNNNDSSNFSPRE